MIAVLFVFARDNSVFHFTAGLDGDGMLVIHGVTGLIPYIF